MDKLNSNAVIICLLLYIEVLNFKLMEELFIERGKAKSYFDGNRLVAIFVD
jgi:hypothetical protein